MLSPRDSPNYTALLAIWRRLPAADQHRLLSFAAFLLSQRTGKREQRAKGHQRPQGE